MRRNAPARRGGLDVSEGPLLTEHLMDLDLELELLKRKREMIEKQHQLYTMPLYEPQSHYADYEPPRSYNQQNFGSNRDFSYMYNDGPSYGDQHGRKRQADPIWDHETQPQMFPNKKKPIQSIFGSRLGPKPGPSGPSNAGPAPARYQRPQPNTSHNPTFKKSPMPLMTVYTPIGQRPTKRVVLKAPTGLSKVTKPKPATAPNKFATKPVAERVSLVAEASKSSATVDEALVLRKDRTPTRQMTGRLELTLGNILKEIKDRYGSSLAYMSLFNTLHTQRVMKQTIRERIGGVMMNKVVGSTSDIMKMYRARYPVKTDVDILNVALAARASVPEVKPDSPKVVEAEDADKSLKAKMFNLMDAKLSAMFNKLKEIHDKERNDKGGEMKLEEIVSTDDAVVSKNEASGDVDRHRTASEIAKGYMPRLMRKHYDSILYLMDVDEMYAKAGESIAGRANELADEKVSSVVNEKPEAATAQDHEDAPAERPSLLITLPYYVKIKSRPCLPKKIMMRDFLSNFNTKTIKKHKTVHNLLFVGFSEKSDYEKILTATGTAIGRSVLEITPSEKATQKPDQEDNDDDILNTSLDKIIGPELDGQITDLLISIRKAEEEENVKNGEEMDTSEGKPLRNEGSDENAPAIKVEIVQDEVNMEETTDAKSEALVKTEIVAEEDKNQSNNLQENVKTDNAAKPEKDPEMPMTVVEIPKEVIKATEKDAVTPAKVAKPPVKVAATPVKCSETSKVANATANAAATSTKVAETPTKPTATPAKVANTPAKVAAAPAKVAETPTKVAATPAKVANETAKAVNAPAKVAETAKVAATSAKATETPTKLTATPANVANAPAKVAATPIKAANAPPAKVADTKTSVTPVKVANAPAKVVETPAKVANAPAKVAQTPKAAEAPAKIAEQNAVVAESSEKIADDPERSENTAESLVKDAEPPNNVVEDQNTQENLESEQTDTVSELKGEAKETGRSTPTRMTRSANVTPSTIRTRRASRLAQNQ